MWIFPAIDIIDGCVVRLYKGDYAMAEVYDVTPADAAAGFEAKGAGCLHVVDLDGAKDGALSNFDAIKSIVDVTGMFVEVGGGIRDEARIEKYLTLGASRVILGTAAVNDFAFLTDMVRKYGDKIAVGVDAKDGFVAVDGWTTVTKFRGPEFCVALHDIGVKTVIYTDIDRDGALLGANIEVYGELSKIKGLDIVASGGISSVSEITRLRDMGISGAIVGKAIYTGVLDLEEALEAASC